MGVHLSTVAKRACFRKDIRGQSNNSAQSGIMGVLTLAPNSARESSNRAIPACSTVLTLR